MYKYNLIIKRGDLDNEAADAMVNQQLTQRFGPDVHYLTSAKLDNEVVVIVQHESKRTLQSTLGDWFTQRPSDAPYPVGTLLHYRQILSDEPIYNQLGG